MLSKLEDSNIQVLSILCAKLCDAGGCYCIGMLGDNQYMSVCMRHCGSQTDIFLYEKNDVAASRPMMQTSGFD